ncbi:MAG: transposase, partial [Nitrososphaerota archaeon]|nr:transposase [Nitrososphaerota archaeon]
IMDEIRMRLKTADGLRKLLVRKELVEHPFGSMKRAFNQGYLLLRGLRKVKGEVGLTMLAYNMKRAMNILGVEMLVQYLFGAIE